MKKIIVIVGLVICLIACWGVTALDLLQVDDKGPQAEHYRILGHEQLKLGGYGLARESFQELLKLQDTPENRLELAQAYLDAGLLEDFKKSAEDMLTTYPEDIRGYEMLAGYYGSVGAGKECMKVLTRAREADIWTDQLEELYYGNGFQFYFLPGVYEKAAPMYCGMAVVEDTIREGTKDQETLQALVDTAGDVVGKATFRKVSGFEDDCAFAVSSDGKNCGFIDAQGSWYMVSDTEFDQGYPMISGIAVVFRNGKAEFINRSGDTQLGPFEDATSFVNGVAAVKNKGQWMLMDSSGKQVGDTTYMDVLRDENGVCSRYGVIFVQTKSGWQLVDTEGKPCSKLFFEQVKPFFDGTFAAVCADGKWGFINKDGEWAAEPSEAGAGSFGFGMAPVLRNGKWGYVDTRLKLVIDPQFLEAGPVDSNGVAPVKTESGWSYIKLIR